MKRIFKFFLVFLITFLLFLSFFNKKSYSQNPTPTPTESTSLGDIPVIGQSLSGLTCGDAESDNPNFRKCCQANISKDFQIPDFGCLVDSGVKALCISDTFNKVKDWFIKNSPVGQIIIFTQRNIKPCNRGEPKIKDNQCICEITPVSATILCETYLKNNPKELNECKNKCQDGVWTALGCFKSNISDFIRQTLFGIGIGLGGIAALLCIIYSAFILQTSGGNPEKIKKAQELLTSCIMGLMLIIFSVFILRLIGVDILQIPGFE